MAEEKKEKKGLFKEFKEFITRGNVLDLAVGIIIGGAFTAIVTALTTGILQPLINLALSAMMGKDGLAGARTILGNPVYVLDDAGAATTQIDWAKTNYIDWGMFITAVINFLLVAIVLFIIIKIINKAHEAGEKAKNKLKKPAVEEPKEEAK